MHNDFAEPVSQPHARAQEPPAPRLRTSTPPTVRSSSSNEDGQRLDVGLRPDAHAPARQPGIGLLPRRRHDDGVGQLNVHGDVGDRIGGVHVLRAGRHPSEQQGDSEA